MVDDCTVHWPRESPAGGVGDGGGWRVCGRIYNEEE